MGLAELIANNAFQNAETVKEILNKYSREELNSEHNVTGLPYKLTTLGFAIKYFHGGKKIFEKVLTSKKIDVTEYCCDATERTALHLACGSGAVSKPTDVHPDIPSSTEVLRILLEKCSIEETTVSSLISAPGRLAGECEKVVWCGYWIVLLSKDR